MLMNTGPMLYSVIPLPMSMNLMSRSQMKVSIRSYFRDYWTDSVYDWFDDRYQSEDLFINTLTYSHDLAVKVTDLDILYQIFVSLVFTAHISVPYDGWYCD